MSADPQHGGVVVARALAAAGVETVYTLVGGHTTPIIDACPAAGVGLLDVRHEEAAAHMAHAYARATGRPGVAVVTAGPGVTNTATAIANAWSGGAPLVVIGGRPPLAQADRGALHEMDQLAVMRPITKWAATVYETSRLAEYVGRALDVARSGRPGPVFLEIPSDVLREDTAMPARLPSPPTITRSAPAEEALAEAAGLLESAERPMIVAGSGVFWSDAAAELLELADMLQAPIIATHAARGIVPFDHPFHVPAARSRALGGADVVLVAGSRLNFMLAYGQPPRWAPEGRLIQIDIEPEEIGHNRAADVALVADARTALAQLARAVPRREASPWLAELREVDQSNRSRVVEAAQVDAAPIHPLRLLRELSAALKPDAYVACDGGDILSFARQALPVSTPGSWLDSGSFGCLGYGIAAACAAKAAFPDRQCVALLGDGALGLQATELDTAARHGLGILVVVSTNGAWAIETTSQRMEFGRAVATELERRPYHVLAKALGCEAVEVTDPAELAAAFSVAPEDGPLVVNVQTDPEAKSPDATRGLGLVPREQAVRF